MRTMEQLETALVAAEDATVLTMAEVLENLAEMEIARIATGPAALRAAAQAFREMVENRPAEAEDGEKH